MVRRLWFVRMPKPAEDSSTAAVEAEVEGYRMQVQLLNESLTIKRVRVRTGSSSDQLLHGPKRSAPYERLSVF